MTTSISYDFIIINSKIKGTLYNMFVKLGEKNRSRLHFPLIEYQGNDDVANILHYMCTTMGSIFQVTLPLFLYVASL